MYKNNLNYKDTVIARNGVTKQSRTVISLIRLPHYARNDDIYCKSSILNSSFLILNFSKSAFSLIELSIVLIIIGLLIAGVTGGASLIQSAKVRQMMNELKDYERAVYTFQAAKGRYPGDVKNYGTFGEYSNYDDFDCSAKPFYKYQSTDFSSNLLTGFQKTAGADVVPNRNSGLFLELYNDGIIGFKPLGNELTADKNNAEKSVPTLKVEPKAFLTFLHTASCGSLKSKQPCEKGVDGCGSTTALVLNGQIKEVLELYYPDYSETKGFDPKLLKAVDEKLDDGWYSTGSFRSSCHGSNGDAKSSYDNAIKNGKKCGCSYCAI